MDIKTLYKIKNNSNSLRYLREKSYWYKYLNRSDLYYKSFIDEMKNNYNLTISDRIKKVSEGIDSISKIIDILN